MATLKADEALRVILLTYTDVLNVFFPNLAPEFPKHTGINDHALELIDDK